MKRHTTLFLMLLFIIPIFGFGKETPDKVLINYLKALYSNNLEKTYSYISKADRNTISRNEFIKQNRLENPFAQEIAVKASSLRNYEINKITIHENIASVDITVIAPDMPRILGEIFGPFHGPKNMKDPQEAARHMLRQYLEKGDIPMAEERGSFTLTKEDGKWKVLLNLNKQCR